MKHKKKKVDFSKETFVKFVEIKSVKEASERGLEKAIRIVPDFFKVHIKEKSFRLK